MTEARSPHAIPRWVTAALIAVATWFLTMQFFHVFREAINWDEFALLERADRTFRLGEIVGGGRPGLVTLVLAPFVRDCIDSVQAVVNARLLWVGLTVLYLVGVYALVRRWHIHSLRKESGHQQALLAVALLAFLPAFVTWSVQVRTDQAALAAAVWGGALLLASGYFSAALAGALFATSLLSTQKGIYVIALCGVLFATATSARLAAASPTQRRELTRAASRVFVAAAAAALVIVLYIATFPEVARLASGDAMSSSMQVMQWTRERQGYRIYTVHANRLVVHWLLFGLLLLWTARVITRRAPGQALAVISSWLVLALGGAVVAFHGSSFPYFMMTAGLFLAIGLSLTTGATLQSCGRLSWLVLVALIALSALQSMRESVEMLADTQFEQHQTLRLIYTSNLRNRRGYQVEGALFCARDPAPLRPMFSEGINRHFRLSPDATRHTQEFIAEFRNRPVAYLVESYRLRQFPVEVNRFFANHYVWYGKSLYLAGFRLDFADHGAREVEVIVPGRYRWTPDPQFRDRPLVIADQTVLAFEEVELQAGTYLAAAEDKTTVGSLILADLPASAREGYPSFYHQRQIRQLGGRR